MTMPRKRLTKKPLVEAILELHWRIHSGSGGPTVASSPSIALNAIPDPRHKLHFSRILDRLAKDYPSIEALPAAGFPEGASIGLVQYRLRQSENAWPLIQIGPGVLTVNETDK